MSLSSEQIGFWAAEILKGEGLPLKVFNSLIEGQQSPVVGKFAYGLSCPKSNHGSGVFFQKK